MGSRGLRRLGLKSLLAICAGIGACTSPHAALADLTNGQAEEGSSQPCGWIGVAVTPITPVFAASLRMAEPYGAIFAEPQPGSPAAAVHIERGDVVTSINGVPLLRASDFPGIIARIAPRTTVYLYTWRNGQPRPVQVLLGSGPCG
jgi:S1-C subfamily serine protease